jgi:hypothetical protein
MRCGREWTRSGGGGSTDDVRLTSKSGAKADIAWLTYGRGECRLNEVLKLRKSENELADGSIKLFRLNDVEGLSHAADFDRAMRQP